MIENTLKMALSENYPMIIIFTIVMVAIRLMYLLVNNEKFVFYKELMSLVSLLYALLLFYVVTFQDVNYGTNNFVPFKEIFRYTFGSRVFIHNIIGNIILFVPFGYFVAHIMKTKNPLPTIIISLVTSSVIEFTQLKIGRTFDVDDIILNLIGSFLGALIYITINCIENKLPSIFRTNLFKNIIVILFVILIVILYSKYTFWGIIR
ncbi:MAG: VanZ family protein [Bacilli bacterium]|nr:VanZ family protein [Bacilli bacterium]